MPANKDNYVIINIWTSKDNKAMPGFNVGHASLTTPCRHISLWPGKRLRKNQTGFFQKAEAVLATVFADVLERSADYKKGYEQDCVFEAYSEGRYREIKEMDELLEGETLYRFDSKTHTFTQVDTLPNFCNDTEWFWAMRLLPANFRVVLYSLDSKEIEGKFDRLKKQITGWTLLGSNVLTRNFSEKTSENCASLVYRCLVAGGMYVVERNSKLSSQTSSIVSPDGLLRHIVAAKEGELLEFSETAEWTIDGVIGSSLKEIKRAYEAKGLNANAEADIFPEIKPSEVCIML
jgi:hypothetical protein